MFTFFAAVGRPVRTANECSQYSAQFVTIDTAVCSTIYSAKWHAKFATEQPSKFAAVCESECATLHTAKWKSNLATVWCAELPAVGKPHSTA